jgi:hypothetical protein
LWVALLLPNVVYSWPLHVCNREINRFWERLHEEWPG